VARQASRLCSDIAANYYASVLKAFEKHGTFFENQAPEAVGEPGNTSKAEFVGWGGIGPVAVGLEYIWGLRPHSLSGGGVGGEHKEDTLLWEITGCGEFGVARYPWKGGFLHLECGERRGERETPSIWILSTVAVRVCVRWGGRLACSVGGSILREGGGGGEDGTPHMEGVVMLKPNMEDCKANEAFTGPARLWGGCVQSPLPILPNSSISAGGLFRATVPTIPLFDLSALKK